MSRIRFDIVNSSKDTIYWIPESSNPMTSHIKDILNNKILPKITGFGAQGNKDEGFSVNIEHGACQKVTFNPGSRGSIFIHFQGLPQDTLSLAVVLTGFSINDSNEIWSINYDNVPNIYDTVPLH